MRLSGALSLQPKQQHRLARVHSGIKALNVLDEDDASSTTSNGDLLDTHYNDGHTVQVVDADLSPFKKMAKSPVKREEAQGVQHPSATQRSRDTQKLRASDRKTLDTRQHGHGRTHTALSHMVTHSHSPSRHDSRAGTRDGGSLRPVRGARRERAMYVSKKPRMLLRPVEEFLQ